MIYLCRYVFNCPNIEDTLCIIQVLMSQVKVLELQVQVQVQILKIKNEARPNI